MNLNDPLGLEAFTQYISQAFHAAAPVAAGGLLLIIVVYGVLRATR